MATNNKVFVEQRKDTGDFAVKLAGAARASGSAGTQAEAIKLARTKHPGVGIHVERVRNTAGGKRDKWRKL